MSPFAVFTPSTTAVCVHYLC